MISQAVWGWSGKGNESYMLAIFLLFFSRKSRWKKKRATHVDLYGQGAKKQTPCNTNSFFQTLPCLDLLLEIQELILFLCFSFE